jgi:Sulfotransferase family
LSRPSCKTPPQGRSSEQNLRNQNKTKKSSVRSRGNKNHRPVSGFQTVSLLDFQNGADNKFLVARKGLRHDAFIDVEYPDLVRNPIEVLRRIYNWLGRGLSCDAELRMRNYLEATSPSKYGLHSYTLAAFDMDPVNLSERFGSYRTRFKLQRLLRHR